MDKLCKCGQVAVRDTGRSCLCEVHYREWLNSRCQGRVWNGFDYSGCERTATVEENGKRYCRQHAPSLVKAKDDARSAARHAEYARQSQRRQLQARREELRDYMVIRYREVYYTVDYAVAELGEIESQLKELEASHAKVEL